VDEGLEEEDEAGVGLGELDELGGRVGAGEGGGGEGAEGMGRVAVEVSAVGDNCGEVSGGRRREGNIRSRSRSCTVMGTSWKNCMSRWARQKEKAGTKRARTTSRVGIWAKRAERRDEHVDSNECRSGQARKATKAARVRGVCRTASRTDGERADGRGTGIAAGYRDIVQE